MANDKLILNIQGAIVKALEAATEAGNEAMLDLLAELPDRIRERGQATDGTGIGSSYSTTPMYAKLKYPQVKNARLKPRGKAAKKGQRNQGKFKNGKPRKSMYLPGGYAELRQLVGRTSPFVNLEFTGNLLDSIQVGSTSTGNKLEFLTQENADLAGHLETKYNKTIFAASDIEMKAMDAIVEAAMDKAFFDTLDNQ